MSDNVAEQIKLETAIQGREIGEVIRTGTQRELNLSSIRTVMSALFPEGAEVDFETIVVAHDPISGETRSFHLDGLFSLVATAIEIEQIDPPQTS